MAHKSIFSQSFGLVWCALLVCLAVGSSYGQRRQGIIHVTDLNNHEAVSFANVSFQSLSNGIVKYGLTSIDGNIVNDVKETSKISISYMGYTTSHDTIRPGQSLEVRLASAVYNMDEIVVTGQYSPERVDHSLYRIDVISSRMIEMKAATNMADLLKDQPSMRVSQDGVLGTSLTIQGMSGENVKFLQNGVPLIGRMNGNFDLNQINLNNVDHVEIVEGPMSVIYGSNALAGVVNIITKENKSSLVSASANAYYESVGAYNADASVSMNKNKNGFFLDGGRNFFQGYSYKDTSRVLPFKPRRQYFFDGFYSYTGEVMKLKLSGDYFNELLVDAGPLQPVYYETAFDSYYTTIRYSGRADVAFNLPHSHNITLIGSYSSYTRRKLTYFKDLTTLVQNLVETGSVNDTTGIQSVVARGTFAQSNDRKRFNYQAGFDIDDEIGTGKRILGNRQDIGDYAAFVSLKWDPVKVLSFQPGARFIYNTKYSAPLVYALSAKWEMPANLALRFSYSRGFRTPDLKELYLYFIDIIHNVHGNPDLKAERSHNFDLNLSWNKDYGKTSWAVKTSGFYNLIDNVIILAQVKGLEYQYVNVDKYRTTGGQIDATFNLYPSLRLQASTGLTGISAEANGSGTSSPYIFAQDVTLSGSYRISKPDITLSVFYKFTGKTPQISMDEKTVGIGYINAYNTMDITVAKGFWKQRIRISAGVKNLFDTKTIPATGVSAGAHTSASDMAYIGWGRTYFLRLSLNFNKYK
jgi:outer membrane receptor for ferrienterochelin and colicins